MPITREQALPVAELLCQLNTRWNVRGVMTRGLAPLEHHPAPLPVIVWAAIRAAQDPNVLTPAVIPLNGPHWNLADRPPAPRLTPDQECPHHPGQWAGNCPNCRADQIALEKDDPWHDADHTDPDTARATARQQIADARQAATPPATTTPGTHLCGHPHPEHQSTPCRRPPAHDGPHRSFGTDQLEWPQENPVTDTDTDVTP